ncbi:DUF4153 domain-containing protein [Melittangium boletus]|uniref:Uncharacterized protein n=1 Tax=Melittangium boletus DSM 14713 TaxID=1294270 RepID=A0A250I8C0_9BACT|nr:DUF4173 domain-containing protein [Melittangium boletus]ATB28005.1 hypothetical protein MEBOL_001450 [Melittangium boletus DSM 14713]
MTPTATGLPLPDVSLSPSATTPRLRHPRATLLAALGLGVCAEVFFDGPALGVSVPLFSGLLVGVLLVLGGREGWQRARPNAWMLGPLLFFSGMVFVRASPLLTALNVLATLFLGLLLTHFWAAGRVERLGLLGYPFAAMESLGHAVTQSVGVVHSEVGRWPVRGQLSRWLPVARGALLALPVLVVFTELLVSADAVFEAMVMGSLSWLVQLFSLGTVWRGLFVGASALGVLGLLAQALRRRRARELGEVEVAPVAARLGFTECITLLGLVDVLFLVFTFIQCAFLWGVARLPEGVTYAGYARRGFFELLAVSVLTLGLGMALTRWTRLTTGGQVKAFRVACSVMVGLVLVLLVSAMKRMALYEAAYGYTHLRVYTQVFMVALAGVLVWRAVTLWWRPERFAIGAFVGALACIAALDLLNPDAFIARGNLERFTQGLSWDDAYVLALSEDAAPVLAAHLAKASEDGLAPSLHEAFCRYPEPMQGGWPAFHLARHRAATLTSGRMCPVPENKVVAMDSVLGARETWE